MSSLAVIIAVWRKRNSTYINALLTSPMAITPSFSPSIFCENNENASFISVSSAAVILCSLASLDRGPAAGAEVSLRLAGWGFC